MYEICVFFHEIFGWDLDGGWKSLSCMSILRTAYPAVKSDHRPKGNGERPRVLMGVL